MSEKSCIFCKIVAGELPAQVIWQDDDILVIKDIHPKAPIHYLIIPKKHSRDLLDTSLENSLSHKLFVKTPQYLAQTVPGAEAFNLIVNNGAGAGQVIFHLHAHFLAGKKLFNL